MLLKEVRAHNYSGELLTISIDDEENESIFIKEILGLGPVRATLASTAHANLDGAQFQSARREPRNIVLKLGLDPDLSSTSIFSVRSELYRFFMPKTEVRLEFVLFDRLNQNPLNRLQVFETTAVVESNEPQIFSSQPSVDISMMVYDDPSFVDQTPVVVSGVTVDDLTEFVIDYKGTVETGMVFSLAPLPINGTVTEFTLYHILANDDLRSAYFNHTINPGDIYKVSSEFGNKYVTFTPESQPEVHMLYTMTAGSDWLVLTPGVNRLRVYSPVAGVPFEIQYKNKYGGL